MSKTMKLKIATVALGLSLTAQSAHAIDWNWRNWLPGNGKSGTAQQQGWGRDGQTARNTTQEPRVIKVEKDSKVDKYFTNLTERAAKGELPDYIEGERTLREIDTSFEKETNKSVALVAPRGAGKTAAIEGYAQYLYDGGSDKVVMLLDAKELVSDSSDSSKGMQALQNILSYLRRNQNVILFIDEVHLLFPKDKPSDLANAMKDDLSRGRVSIGTATTDIEWREYVEKDQAWLDRFNIVRIPEMTFNRIVAILQNLQSRFEAKHGVKYMKTAFEEVARQIPKFYASDSYARKAMDIADRLGASEKLETERGNIDRLEAEGRMKTLVKSQAALERDLQIVPDDQETQRRFKEVQVEITSLQEQINELKAREDLIRLKRDLPKMEEALKNEKDLKKLDVLKKALVDIKQAINMAGLQEGVPGVLNRINVINYVATDTGTPADIVAEEPIRRFTRLDQNFASELVGQEGPAKEIVSHLRRSEAGLEEVRGPKNLVVLVGGSALEQGLVVDILNEANQGKENKPIQVNFNEFADQQTATHRLLGIETGYVGSDRGGVLDSIREKTAGTLHLNNVDQKPHVLSVLSRMFESGQMQNSIQKPLDFRNATVIVSLATVGSEYARDRHQLSRAEIETKYGFAPGTLQNLSQKNMDSVVIERLMLKAEIPANIVSSLKSKVVILNPTDFKAVKTMTERLLNRKEAYIRSKFGVELKIDPSVSEAIARSGFSPTAGAQGVQGSISNILIDTLAEIKVLAPDTFKEGSVLDVKFIENSTKTGGDLEILKDGQSLGKLTLDLGVHPEELAKQAQTPTRKRNPTLKVAPEGKTTTGRVGRAKNPTDTKAIVKDAVTKAKRTK